MLRPLPPALATKLTGRLRASGDQWVVACPAHDDGTPSLAIKVVEDDRVLFQCHASCPTENILAALSLTWRDIMGDTPEPKPEQGEWTPVQNAAGEYVRSSAIYPYYDESGTLLYEVVKAIPDGKKTFRQRRPDPTKKTGWAWNLHGVRPVLYQLPKVLEAVGKGEEILVVEGERDVQTAEGLGRVATCNSGGAGKFLPDMARVFGKGASVLVIADADEPGRKHARSVKALIEAEGGIVRVAECVEGFKDLTDHVNAGFGLSDLRIIEDVQTPDLGLIWIEDLLADTTERYDWLIEGLLERGERVMITGCEGGGKSSLLRQFAICVAAGIHPFDAHAIEPKKVIWMDAENSRRQNIRRFDPLMHMTIRNRDGITPKTLGFFLRPEGLDLSREDDAAWFHERIALTRPDLLVIGPWYRLFNGNPNDEEKARKVIATLDLARANHGFAVMIEAHSPHSDGFKTPRLGGVRPVRPLGSSILVRWPEYGYGLSFRDLPPEETGNHGLPDFNYADFLAWRGARDEREWPQAFMRSNDDRNWPWLPCEPRPLGDSNFDAMQKEARKSGPPKAYARDEKPWEQGGSGNSPW